MSLQELELSGSISPFSVKKEFSQRPELSDYKEEYYDVLSTMINEQAEHLYGKFNESYLKYRSVVIAWMIDVCEYFHLHITTNHMAIAYLDRLQPNEKFSRFEWQILAISCIIIAAKYNEMEEHVPGLKKIEEITQQAIPNDTFLYYELWVLKKMGWKLNARVPSTFLCAQIELGLLSDQDIVLTKKTSGRICKKVPITSEIRDSMKEKIDELSNKCMLDTHFKSIQASAVATAIIYYVRRLFRVTPAWNDRLTELTFYCPNSSRSTLKALQLIIELEKSSEKENSAVNQSSSDISKDDLLVEEESEDYDQHVHIDTDAEDADEEADLVKALHKALFVGDNSTPSKETNPSNHSLKTTPVIYEKFLLKGQMESFLSPVAINEMISP